MATLRRAALTFLTFAVGCGAQGDETGDTVGSTPETSSETMQPSTSTTTSDEESTSTNGETMSSGETDTSLDTSSGSTGEIWPACVEESGPDVAIGITLDPAQPDEEWHRYAAACTVSSIGVEDSTVTVALDCTGGDGPAPEWSATLTVDGLAGELPSELVQDASVDLVVVVQQLHFRFTAFSMSVAGELVMAGTSGNNPNVEEGMGDGPQALWAPLVVTPDVAQVCPTQPGVDCPLTVARNAVVFSGLDSPDVELFDHSSVVGSSYAYALGRALAFVDDGSGMVCEGSEPTWYDFVVSRVPSR
jgi:hypothetical protein